MDDENTIRLFFQHDLQVDWCRTIQPGKIHRLTGLWISSGPTREFARVGDRPMQPFDGRREASDRKQMAGRNPDGADASRRVIDLLGG